MPMRIDNDKGCPVPSRPVDLGPNCQCPLIPRERHTTSLTFWAGPTPLKGPFDSNGFPVGCKSACAAGLSPDPNNSPNCCTGSHKTLKPACRLALPITLISVRSFRSTQVGVTHNTWYYRIPTPELCMHMMNQAGRHFSLAHRQRTQITRLRSVPDPSDLRIEVCYTL